MRTCTACGKNVFGIPDVPIPAPRRSLAWVYVLAIVLILGAAAYFTPKASPPITSSAPAGTPATISGSDGTGGTIDEINVWASYSPRGAVVARLRPGTQVTMLRRDGDGVLIRTSDGVEGWVTYWFIVGLKK